ncbi:hypothetical protein C8A05DRAFT_38704, partial [Staphylotrichum tortipilum]
MRLLPAWLPLRSSPVIPGMDFAGEVLAIGDKVDRAALGGLQIGDLVAGAVP